MNVEDIDYLKEFGEVNNIKILIDSSMRNKLTFDSANFYTITFEEPIKNVVGVEVLDAAIPATEYNIDDNNDAIDIGYLVNKSTLTDDEIYDNIDLFYKYSKQFMHVFNGFDPNKHVVFFNDLQNFQSFESYALDYDSSNLLLFYENIHILSNINYINSFPKFALEYNFSFQLFTVNPVNIIQLPNTTTNADKIVFSFIHNVGNYDYPIPIIPNLNDSVTTELLVASFSRYCTINNNIIHVYDASNTTNHQFDASCKIFDYTFLPITLNNVNDLVPIFIDENNVLYADNIHQNHNIIKDSLEKKNRIMFFFHKYGIINDIDNDISIFSILNIDQNIDKNDPYHIQIMPNTKLLRHDRAFQHMYVDDQFIDVMISNTSSDEVLSDKYDFFFHKVILNLQHGFYDSRTLIKKLQEKFIPSLFDNNISVSINWMDETPLNENEISITQKIVFYSTSSTHIDLSFFFDYDKFTMADNLGFSEKKNQNMTYVKIDGINRLIRSRISTSDASTLKIEPSGIIILENTKYVTLACPEVEAHILGAYSSIKAATGIATFKLVQSNSVSNLRFDFLTANSNMFHPIGKLSKLTFKFLTNSGNLYNFKGAEHIFLLNIKFYNAKKNKFNGQYQLNELYNPNIIEFNIKHQHGHNDNKQQKKTRLLKDVITEQNKFI